MWGVEYFVGDKIKNYTKMKAFSVKKTNTYV